MTAAVLVILLLFMVGCSQKEDETDESLSGGYTEDRDLTDEDMAVFEQAMAGLLGVTYEPTRVATQVVAGLNYRFTCTATIVVPGAEPYTAYVYIFQPLGDGAPELVSIEKDE